MVSVVLIHGCQTDYHGRRAWGEQSCSSHDDWEAEGAMGKGWDPNVPFEGTPLMT